MDSNSVFTRYNDYGALTEANTGTTALLKLSNLTNDYTVDFEVYQVDGANTIMIFALYNTNT